MIDMRGRTVGYAVELRTTLVHANERVFEASLGVSLQNLAVSLFPQNDDVKARLRRLELSRSTED